MKKRIHSYFSGTVQGVGFRYTAERAAHALGLTGWVKNLPDGRVELVAEGAEEDLAGLIRRLKDVFGGYLTDVETVSTTATGEFATFDVAFD